MDSSFRRKSRFRFRVLLAETGQRDIFDSTLRALTSSYRSTSHLKPRALPLSLSNRVRERSRSQWIRILAALSGAFYRRTKL